MRKSPATALREDNPDDFLRVGRLHPFELHVDVFWPSHGRQQQPTKRIAHSIRIRFSAGWKRSERLCAQSLSDCSLGGIPAGKSLLSFRAISACVSFPGIEAQFDKALSTFQKRVGLLGAFGLNFHCSEPSDDALGGTHTLSALWDLSPPPRCSFS